MNREIIRALRARPDSDFISGGHSRGRAWELARLLAQDPKPRFRVAHPDKYLVAAAILARLLGGPPLVLPASLDQDELDRLHKTIPGLAPLTGHDLEQCAAGKHAPRPDPALLDQELARIHTGGTTGRPRIWPKTGVNLLGEAHHLCQALAITPRDRILATIPPHHIYGLLFSVLVPLVSGASVVAEQPSFPEEIRTAAGQYRATILVSVPPHYRALAGRPLDAPDLRLAFSSAGPLGRKENLDFTRQNNVQLIEVFGSTETGGIGTRNRAAGEEGFTPFAPVRWQVRDGLLAVRSPFLSPELPVDGEGWFQTADRARVLANNTFLPLGRADAVAKVGGRRVDLDEIQNRIKGLAGVRDCVVMALPDPGGRGSRIGALVTGRVDPATIRELIVQQLEPHARPRIIRVVEAIPVRANGKPDRPAILELLQ